MLLEFDADQRLWQETVRDAVTKQCPASLVRGVAEKAGRQAVRLTAAKDKGADRAFSRWVAVTGNRETAESLRLAPQHEPWQTKDPPPLVFSDDFSSLFRILKLGLI